MHFLSACFQYYHVSPLNSVKGRMNREAPHYSSLDNTATPIQLLLSIHLQSLPDFWFWQNCLESIKIYVKLLGVIECCSRVYKDTE